MPCGNRDSVTLELTRGRLVVCQPWLGHVYLHSHSLIRRTLFALLAFVSDGNQTEEKFYINF